MILLKLKLLSFKESKTFECKLFRHNKLVAIKNLIILIQIILAKYHNLNYGYKYFALSLFVIAGSPEVNHIFVNVVFSLLQ